MADDDTGEIPLMVAVQRTMSNPISTASDTGLSTHVPERGPVLLG